MPSTSHPLSLQLSNTMFLSHYTHIQPITVIDLKALGFGGELPSLVTKAIETTKQNEPLVWDSVLSDPIAKRFLSNPTLAVQEAVDAASDYVNTAKASSQ